MIVGMRDLGLLFLCTHKKLAWFSSSEETDIDFDALEEVEILDQHENEG